MTRKVTFYAAVVVALAMPRAATAEDPANTDSYLDDLFSRYEMWHATSPPVDDAALLAAIASVSVPYEVHLFREADVCGLRWNPEAFTVLVEKGGIVEELPAIVANGRFVFGSGLAANDESDGGWIAPFEGGFIFRVLLDGEVTEGAISPIDDGEGPSWMSLARRCTCLGAVGRCSDQECELRTPCGQYSNGTCTWVEASGAAPAPPAQPTCQCGSASAVMSLTTVLGFAFMKLRLSQRRLRQRWTP
jgi:hypothetical protein